MIFIVMGTRLGYGGCFDAAVKMSVAVGE